MKKIVALFLVVIAVMLVPAVVFAASPWTEKTTYADKVKYKLDFGVKNILGGITEIYTQPKNYHKEKKNMFEGVGKGLWYALADTVGGALHILTFPIPQLDVPLPENGVSFS